MTEKYKKILAAILLILFVLYWAAVNFLVSAVLVPSFMEKLDAFQRISEQSYAISEQSYAEQVQETEMKQNLTAMTVVGKVWGRQQGIEHVEILSEDGYRLRGVLMQASGDAAEAGQKSAGPHRWVVLLHGYTGSKEMMYGYAYWYWMNGYSVLAPDFRCQGESEGDYIGLGATDSKDLAGWIGLICTACLWELPRRFCTAGRKMCLTI